MIFKHSYFKDFYAYKYDLTHIYKNSTRINLSLKHVNMNLFHINVNFNYYLICILCSFLNGNKQKKCTNI